ncbi:helix-turn-helix transcriptional regulator [Arthrobacter woluwensis]|uniref:Helix-turn-helix domain-containing protein n=1 Tax=Arthrobacter woluwensis TaxID=156980 RepID=A0A1H4WB33_9MICC|nr:helix-turn-helix domain-containing protein [Arthrobacter woluwensis]SEC53981.1 Helix-turn-helix domain-containing protein [Arthrobacter woluwensis]SEC90425.1 Helix-turn-helix domain-containing protein [Arthrobacter woluwensis]
MTTKIHSDIVARIDALIAELEELRSELGSNQVKRHTTQTGGLDELLTAEEIASWLGKSVQSLAQDRYRGVGPAFIRVGTRAVRYRKADVEAWLTEVVGRQANEG